jgi:hypothetical protein
MRGSSLEPGRGRSEPESFYARRVLLLYATGIYLQAVVFLSPHSGYLEGRSFVQVALASSWDQWWDWPAAWCSVKIILFGLGLGLLIAALGLMLKLVKRDAVGNALLCLSSLCALGFWLGSYYLVKALF